MYIFKLFLGSIWRTYISKIVITPGNLISAWRYIKTIGKGHALSAYYAENFQQVFGHHLCKGGRESWRIKNLALGIVLIPVEIILIVLLIKNLLHPGLFGGLWRVVFIIAIIVVIARIKHNWTQVGTVLYSTHLELTNNITNGAESLMTAEGEEELVLFDNPPAPPAPAAPPQNPAPSAHTPATNPQNPPPQSATAPAQPAPHSNCPPGTRPYNG